ncbi:MAG: HEAT repeat domain-containing protein, partial [Myxococcales bacterium]|nr:HEAT repeat domain-containing protein [Myxococcales bacterium]
VVLTASKKDHVRRLAETLIARVSFESLDFLQQRAERGLLFHSEWLLKLAVAESGGRPSRRTLELIEEGLRSRSPRTRFHAALAVGHCRSEELRSELASACRVEVEEEVRAAMSAALDLLQK